jgi:CheY-like chemotaxis protein
MRRNPEMPKIMLVEDDLTMVSLLTTLLQMEGFQVARLRKEENIAQVMETMCSEQPDLALMDIHLRQFNGFDLLKQIRSDSALQSLRVVMVSGMDLRQKCMQAGANGFLLKPFMPDDLIQLIRDTLQNTHE